MRKSQVHLAVESIDREIDVLLKARAKLMEQIETKAVGPKRVRTRTKRGAPLIDAADTTVAS
jgi:hypothetical protein